MNILLVGCGSVGKRHLKNLNKLPGVERIFVFSKVKDCLNDFGDKSKVSLVGSLDSIRPDLAVIANETSKHIDTAIILARRKIHSFIEKPLAHRLSGKLNVLKKIASRNKVKIGVGYNLRFLGAIKYIKTLLFERVLGDIYFVKIEVGQYLPDWRTGRDYRVSYSASRKRGGGVALDLSHEIDYMRYLFGDPRSFKTIKAKVSDLKIDSEDIFEGVYVYGRFICNVHMDYLQKDKKRVIRIEASKGSLVCDLINKSITITINGKRKVVSSKELFDLDNTYVQEILSFTRAIENDHKPEVTLEDGVRVLELIEA